VEASGPGLDARGARIHQRLERLSGQNFTKIVCLSNVKSWYISVAISKSTAGGRHMSAGPQRRANMGRYSDKDLIKDEDAIQLHFDTTGKMAWLTLKNSHSKSKFVCRISALPFALLSEANRSLEFDDQDRGPNNN
jgi:hypothetical protein